MDKNTAIEVVKASGVKVDGSVWVTPDSKVHDNSADALKQALHMSAGDPMMIEVKEADLSTEPETVELIVTEEELKNNPALVEQGVKVGDKIQVAKEN